MTNSSELNKQIYKEHHDKIIEKRLHSSYPIRRHAHITQYNAFVESIPSGSKVLDVGCGEGVLTILLAQNGCQVTGVDISEPNIEACKHYAQQMNVADKVNFLLGDAENIPVEDGTYEYVVSSHVLEHVPDFVKGVKELRRVSSKKVIVAIPTCINPASFVQLGGGTYWTITRHTPYAIFLGGLRVLKALFTKREGVNEGLGYAGNKDLIHVYRFPSVGKKLLEQGGLQVDSFKASSLPFPYISSLIPLSRWLEKFAHKPVLRHCGYGTTYYCSHGK
jgi:ubiquinone/menaquinone biosynthesis C-methylase UbiE